MKKPNNCLGRKKRVVYRRLSTIYTSKPLPRWLLVGSDLWLLVNRRNAAEINNFVSSNLRNDLGHLAWSGWKRRKQELARWQIKKEIFDLHLASPSLFFSIPFQRTFFVKHTSVIYYFSFFIFRISPVILSQFDFIQ